MSTYFFIAFLTCLLIISRLPASDLVTGDIVKITLGSKVPADIRLLDISSDLRFDRSILTGESNAIPASVEPTDPNCKYIPSFCCCRLTMFGVQSWNLGTSRFKEHCVQVVVDSVFVSAWVTTRCLVALLNKQRPNVLLGQP